MLGSVSTAGTVLAFGLGGNGRPLLGVAVLLVALLAAALAVRRVLRGASDRDATDPALRSALDGALITAGGVAVVDNVVFHWLLEFHRFKEGWPYSIHVEVAGVMLGAVAFTAGLRSLRRRRGERSPRA